MKITVDISLYPLDADYKPAIKEFVRALRSRDGLQVRTNQLSTQVNGDFDAVMDALRDCMRESMQAGPRMVFVTRYLNADLDIARPPAID